MIQQMRGGPSCTWVQLRQIHWNLRQNFCKQIKASRPTNPHQIDQLYPRQYFIANPADLRRASLTFYQEPIYNLGSFIVTKVKTSH